MKRCRHAWIALEEHGVWLWCRNCGAVKCEDVIFRPPLRKVKL